MKINAKAAKALRKEANFEPGGKHPGYPFPGIHHLAQIPMFETWVRTIRSWNPKTKKIESREVRKIIYGKDGKTPRSPIYENYIVEKGPHAGETAIRQKCALDAVSKPAVVSIKTPKGMYRLLKKLYKKTTDAEIDIFERAHGVARKGFEELTAEERQ